MQIHTPGLPFSTKKTPHPPPRSCWAGQRGHIGAMRRERRSVVTIGEACDTLEAFSRFLTGLDAKCGEVGALTSGMPETLALLHHVRKAYDLLLRQVVEDVLAQQAASEAEA